MRKFLMCLACLLLLLTASALAETYTFNEFHATIDIPGDYSQVLTQYNLSSKADWLSAQGMDYDATMNEFESEGVFLKAFDEKNNRTFVLTAVKDPDSQMYFDLNLQSEAMRKEFRTNHTNGVGYAIIGYTYSTAQWGNYGGTTLRFLRTKYRLRQDGQQVCTGFQRRTIRNGYTITLDMQVRGREAKDADNSALETLMKSFKFTEILPMPKAPVTLSISSAPPTETNDDTFTVKGKTDKNASVNINVVSLGSGGSKSYPATVSKNGSFSAKITLSAQGVYSITITSTTDEGNSFSRLYSVTYQKGMLPVDITLSPAALLADETVISGSTIRGAKTQLSVSGPVNFSKTATSQTFKFKIDTSAPGTYQFILAVTKKGLVDRVFTYTAERKYTEEELAAKVRSSAKRVTYQQLSKSTSEGKNVVFTGYVASINPSINEWVLTVAMSKNGDSYKNNVYVISKTDPNVAEGAQVQVYGTYTGKYSVLDAEGNVKTYPRVDATFVELN